MVKLRELFPTRCRYDPYRRAGPCTFHDARAGRDVRILAPGEILVGTAADHLLATSLGSTVAIVIHDPDRRYTALAHLLPTERGTRHTGAGVRWATLAATLADAMGAPSPSRTAKLFGGTAMDGDILRRTRADANLRSARAWLRQNRLTVVEEITGGTLPQRIVVVPEHGSVQVLNLRRRSDRGDLAIL